MALTDIVAAFRIALGDDVVVELGQENVGKTVDPPHVLFVPTDDVYSASGSNAGFPRSYGTVSAGCELRIWGAAAADSLADDADLTATEALRNRVIAALKDAGIGSIEFEGGSWQGISSQSLGRGYVLKVRFAIPIVKPAEFDPSTITTYTDIGSPAGTPGGAPAATETTVVFAGSEVVGSPSP